MIPSGNVRELHHIFHKLSHNLVIFTSLEMPGRKISLSTGRKAATKRKRGATYELDNAVAASMEHKDESDGSAPSPTKKQTKEKDRKKGESKQLDELSAEVAAQLNANRDAASDERVPMSDTTNTYTTVRRECDLVELTVVERARALPTTTSSTISS